MFAPFMYTQYPMTPELSVTRQVMSATLKVYLSNTMPLFLVGLLGWTALCNWIENSPRLSMLSPRAPNHMLLVAPPIQRPSV